jgi:hypothetical protein
MVAPCYPDTPCVRRWPEQTDKYNLCLPFSCTNKHILIIFVGTDKFKYTDVSWFHSARTRGAHGCSRPSSSSSTTFKSMNFQCPTIPRWRQGFFSYQELTTWSVSWRRSYRGFFLWCFSWHCDFLTQASKRQRLRWGRRWWCWVWRVISMELDDG